MTTHPTDHSVYMRQALGQAKRGLGRTAPNPPVGAVIVKDGRILGKGFHSQAGQPHAEVCALQNCWENPRGATLYVTLEPCAHSGRTPPCVEAILNAGIRKVVIGIPDPNPIVAGKGVSFLRQSGVEVEEGVCREKAAELIRWYSHWIEKKQAYVIFKAAITLDGRIAATSGDSRWISSESSRARVHRLRNQVDAVLVGIGTVLQDDPLLTCRIPGGRDPFRVVLDPELAISPRARCLGEKCILFTAKDPGGRPELAASGCRVVTLDVDAQGLFSWPEILTCLGRMGCHAVLVEGGCGVYSSILRARRFDQLILFVAPKLLGGGIPLLDLGSRDRIDQCLPLEVTRILRAGGDIIIEAYPED